MKMPERFLPPSASLASRMKQWPLYGTLASLHVRVSSYHAPTHVPSHRFVYGYSRVSVGTCLCVCECLRVDVNTRTSTRQLFVLLYLPRSHYALRTIVGIPLGGLEWFIHVDQLFFPNGVDRSIGLAVQTIPGLFTLLYLLSFSLSASFL